MRLAIITTHPIQYYAPIFILLHERKNIDIHVFYTWGEAALNKYDPGFNKVVAWDIPLLEGYPYTWVKNTSTDPGSHHFKGITNPGLTDLIREFKADAILVFGWAYQSHLEVLRYFKNKIPVFFRGDSTLLDEQGGIRSVFKSVFLKWVYRHVDHAFYTGINNKGYYKKYGLKELQLSFAPHAVDNERFATDRSAEAISLRQQLGLGEDELLILFAGKLEDKKSPMLLADAFIKLAQPKAHLLFLGNGALESELKQKAEGAESIHFMDFQNQSYMPVVYQACDLFCLPSKGPGETWGLAVNEAMACGKAVLVSDKVGCAVDLVKEKYNGAIFKSEDPDNLLTCLNDLTRSKNILPEFGKNSASIIKDWSIVKIAETIENKLSTY